MENQQYVTTGIDPKSNNPFHHHFHRRQQSRGDGYEYEKDEYEERVRQQSQQQQQPQALSPPPQPPHSPSQPHHHHHHHHHRHSSTSSPPTRPPPPAPTSSLTQFNPPTTTSTSEEWKDRGAATIVKSETDAAGHTTTTLIKKGVKDFNFGETLGEGSYSTVVAASDRQTLREYAIKVLDKRHIIKEKKVKYVNIEKNSLNRLGDHPGIIRLYYTFQDERSLYFVLDFASHGELLSLIKKMGSLDEDCTRYYGAQILDAVDFMHSKGVIHRDLKPENILLDYKMRIKITDFGTAKLLDLIKDENGNEVYPQDVRTSSFVGTAEYVSPELLVDKSTDKRSDIWAFGCIIYQMIAGRPPFKASNEYQTFQKIVKLQYSYPPSFPFLVRDLVKQLLILNPKNRLDIAKIKKHEFFAGIDWDLNSVWKKPPPRIMPYKPNAKSLVNPTRMVGAAPPQSRLLPSQMKFTTNPPRPIKAGIPGGVKASAAAAAALGKPPPVKRQPTSPSPKVSPAPATPITATAITTTGAGTGTGTGSGTTTVSATATTTTATGTTTTTTTTTTTAIAKPRPSVATLKATESLKALKRAQSQPVVPVVTTNYMQKKQPPSTPTDLQPPFRNGQTRTPDSSPKLIIPPASQLDSEWSNLLTHHEERILKIGNVPVVSSGSGNINVHTDDDEDKEPSLISKFFNGGNSKRKRRIVIITSAARLLICGEDRRLRVEIPVALPQVNIRELQFNKKANTGAFIVEAHHKFITIEDSSGTSEWMLAISKAKEYYQQATALSESNAATAATAAAIAVGQRPVPRARVTSSAVEGNTRLVNTSNSTFLQRSEERRSLRRRV